VVLEIPSVISQLVFLKNEDFASRHSSVCERAHRELCRTTRGHYGCTRPPADASTSTCIQLRLVSPNLSNAESQLGRNRLSRRKLAERVGLTRCARGSAPNRRRCGRLPLSPLCSRCASALRRPAAFRHSAQCRMAERARFEPDFRLEAKSRENADLIYGQCLRTVNKMPVNADK